MLGGNSDYMAYLSRSGLLGNGSGGIQRRAAYYDHLTAAKSDSIFWTWLSDETYYDANGLATHCSYAFILVNIWFFFIRNSHCFTGCMQNVLNTFSGEKIDKAAPSFR